MRTWFLAWIYSTIAVTAFVIIGGTVAIILDSATLGNLVALWSGFAILSGLGLGTTFGICEVKIPPRQVRVPRKERQRLEQQAAIADLERELNIGGES